MRLVVSDGRIYKLTRPFITMGRSATRDIVIPDPRVSRHHAVLRQYSESYILSDVGSTNGTFVNGLRIADTHILQHGDTIRMGTITLLFQHEQLLQYEPADKKPQQSFDEPLTGLEDAPIDLLDIPMTSEPAVENELSSAKTAPLEDPDSTVKDSNDTDLQIEKILHELTLGGGKKRLVRKLVRNGKDRQEAEKLVHKASKNLNKYKTSEAGQQAIAERAIMQMVPAGLLFLLGLASTTFLYIVTQPRWYYWFLWLAVLAGAAVFLRAFSQWLNTR
ncbi:MAG: FHA domain-containing protein [Anaerolineae bacterium]|nr:FHA domain-containing protein [Anaerolineae bacterium]